MMTLDRIYHAAFTLKDAVRKTDLILALSLIHIYNRRSFCSGEHPRGKSGKILHIRCHVRLYRVLDMRHVFWRRGKFGAASGGKQRPGNCHLWNVPCHYYSSGQKRAFHCGGDTDRRGFEFRSPLVAGAESDLAGFCYRHMHDFGRICRRTDSSGRRGGQLLMNFYLYVAIMAVVTYFCLLYTSRCV